MSVLIFPGKVRTQLRWYDKFYYSRMYNLLKWYNNYKNRLRFAKVIVKNKMSRFLWFNVYKWLFHVYGMLQEWIAVSPV